MEARKAEPVNITEKPVPLYIHFIEAFLRKHDGYILDLGSGSGACAEAAVLAQRCVGHPPISLY